MSLHFKTAALVRMRQRVVAQRHPVMGMSFQPLPPPPPGAPIPSAPCPAPAPTKCSTDPAVTRHAPFSTLGPPPPPLLAAAGNFFFAGARTFFRSLESAVFLFRCAWVWQSGGMGSGCWWWWVGMGQQVRGKMGR